MTIHVSLQNQVFASQSGNKKPPTRTPGSTAPTEVASPTKKGCSHFRGHLRAPMYVLCLLTLFSFLVLEEYVVLNELSTVCFVLKDAVQPCLKLSANRLSSPKTLAVAQTVCHVAGAHAALLLGHLKHVEQRSQHSLSQSHRCHLHLFHANHNLTSS